MNKKSKKLFTAVPIITPLSQIALPLVITFVFFYLINYLVLYFYLRFLAKKEYSLLKMFLIITISSIMAFFALFIAFQLSNQMIFIFLITFVIIGLTNFLLFSNYLKINKQAAISLGLLLAIAANPAVWVWMIEWTKKF